MDGAAAAVLLGGGEDDGRDRRGVGGPVVEVARVGDGGVVLHGDGGSVLWRGRMSSGRCLRWSLGAKTMSNRCAQTRAVFG